MRTFNIPFSFVSSPETEKERLLYACENVASGFYSRHGFLVTPEVVKKYEEWCIVLHPEIKNVDDKFWQDSYKYGVNMHKVITKHMYQQAENINLPSSSTELVKNFEKEWQKYNNKFWIELEKCSHKKLNGLEV